MESSLYIIHYNRGGLKYGHYRITGSWHWHTNIAHSQHDDGQTVSIYRYILYYYRLMYIHVHVQLDSGYWQAINFVLVRMCVILHAEGKRGSSLPPSLTGNCVGKE